MKINHVCAGTARAVVQRRWLGVPAIRFFLMLIALQPFLLAAQINSSEQINMPGAWNSWTNFPTNNLALANSVQVSGGRIERITTGATRYQTIFRCATTGGDVTPGSYEWLFTSGGSGSPYFNKWSATTVSMNTLQNYTFQGGPNNNITVVDNRWYTMNFMDNGYQNTQAIFMVTSAQPVQFTNVIQSPVNGSVTSTDNVVVTVTASNTPSPEELVYVRYSTNNFASSSLIPVVFSGNVGQATIPAQTFDTQVAYYIFSTTVANPAAADVDKVTIRFRNAGTGNYTYTVNGALPPVSVTFQVDMSQQTIDPSGVFISGSFTGWSNVAMTNAGSGIYTYQTTLNQGLTVQWKYKNGVNGWENDPGLACGPNNREYTVVSTIVLDPVCFGSCTQCPSTVPVTFQVDMSQQTVDPGGVFIAGSFNGFSNAAMTNSGGGVWTYIANVPENSTIQWKYKNGPSGWENDPGVACGPNNRQISVATSPVELQPVCFGSCNACASSVSMTFRVNMSQQTVDPAGVFIAGSFNGFSNTAMINSGGGLWTYTTTVPGNSTIQWKYKNGPDGWESDLGAPCGAGNRSYSTGTNGVILPEVCFGSCDDCPPPPTTRQVTFRVNLSQAGASANGVHLAGGFGPAGYANWSANGIPLTDGNADGVYEVTLSLPENTSYQYKFINGNTFGNSEAVPSGCGVSDGFGGFNRTLSVATSNQLLPVVCLSSCSNCPAPPSNDYWQGPVPMIVPNYPSCINTSGSLLNCAPSSESSYYFAPVGAGQDTWYRFRVPASSSGTIRIHVNAENNIAILLQREEASSPFYSAVAQENANSGIGTETMIAQGLIPGQWYRVGIKNMSVAALGTFTVCINSIRSITCTANAATPRILCDAFSCSYAGANSYTFTFTNTGNSSDIYTKTLTGNPASSSVFLSTVPGLAYGTSYDVRVDATFALSNGVGTTSNVVVNGNNGICQLNMAAQPIVQLSSADRCLNSQKVRSSVISTGWVCGVIDYTWEITPNSGLPVAVLTDRGAADRFMRVGSLNGINSGATSFNVRVRPVFSDGAGGRRNGEWGPVQELCLVAPIALDAQREPEEMQRPEERMLQVEDHAKWECYPNPVHENSVWLSLYETIETSVVVSLIDITGKKVREETFNAGSSFIQQEIHVGDLTSGVYLLQIIANGESRTTRLIVE